MRRAFIAFGIIVFLIYCWASVAYQNQVAVPGYRMVTVDVLGKLSREQWDADEQARFQRLMDLEGKRYQLPASARVPAPPGLAERDAEAVTEDGVISPDHPLTSDDFAALVAAAPAGQGLTLELRDTSAITALAGKNYLLRDPVMLPGADIHARPLFNYGRPVDKEMIDTLLRNDVRVITVTGHGVPVSYELGTSLMIAIIFLTLVAALKPVLWDPFLVMLEKRRHELELGAEAERLNAAEQIRFDEEKQRRNARLTREIQELKLKGQREATAAANAIIKEARDEGKQIKTAGLAKINQAELDAGQRLENEIPELAEMIAAALTPGQAGPRWDRLVDTKKDGGN